MHVIACPNHPPVISWPHEFQHLLLFVLGWRKVNWELHVGWRLRVVCMWLCVPYFSPLFFALANGFRFIAIPWHECHCLFCLPFPPFELANGFRFTAIPLAHECHCPFCIPLPVFVFANGFRFTAIPFIFDCMSSNIFSCA